MNTAKDLRGSDLQTFNYPPGLMVEIEGHKPVICVPATNLSMADAIAAAWTFHALERIYDMEDFSARIEVIVYNEREPRIKVRIAQKT